MDEQPPQMTEEQKRAFLEEKPPLPTPTNVLLVQDDCRTSAAFLVPNVTDIGLLLRQTRLPHAYTHAFVIAGVKSLVVPNGIQLKAIGGTQPGEAFVRISNQLRGLWYGKTSEDIDKDIYFLLQQLRVLRKEITSKPETISQDLASTTAE
jgi:hypothetical protein